MPATSRDTLLEEVLNLPAVSAGLIDQRSFDLPVQQQKGIFFDLKGMQGSSLITRSTQDTDQTRHAAQATSISRV